MGDGIGS